MKKIISAIIFLLFLIPSLVYATDWYVRPEGGDYSNEDGTSYNNSWDGLGNVVWGEGGVESGDTLYVCGTHIAHIPTSGAQDVGLIDGTEGNPTVIRGDCPGDQGIIWGSMKQPGSWTYEGNNTYSITFRGTSGAFTNLFMEDVSGDEGTLLTKVASVQDCKNTPGSVYSATWSNGDTLYVHCSDDGDPTNRIYIPWVGYVFYVHGHNYVTFLNIKFRNVRLTYYDQTHTHITWQGCDVKYAADYMIGIGANSHYTKIIDCELHYAENGIYTITPGMTGGASNCLFQNNTIYDMGHAVGFYDLDAHGIGIQGGHGNIVESNEIYNCGSGVTLYAFTNQEMKDNIIRYNYVHDMHTLGGANSRGIEFICDNDASADKSGNKVYQNIVMNADRCYQSQIEYEVEFYNNIAYNCREGFASTRNYNYTGTRVKFRNNIFLNNQLYHIGWHSGANNYLIDSDYNLFYPSENMFRHAIEGGVMNFTEWQAHTASTCPNCVFDPNSLVADPLFVDPDNLDLHLPPNSPAIDAGIFVGLTQDYDGNPIPQANAPDIGAYEFESTGCIDGDLNCDGSVDVADLIIVATNFGLTAGYDNRADTDNNNEVDIFDIVFVASRFT